VDSRSAQAAPAGGSGEPGRARQQFLAPPPRDVGRLLAQHRTGLPHYLDTNRWREIERSQKRWPLLLLLRNKAPGVVS